MGQGPPYGILKHMKFPERLIPKHREPPGRPCWGSSLLPPEVVGCNQSLYLGFQIHHQLACCQLLNRITKCLHKFLHLLNVPFYANGLLICHGLSKKPHEGCIDPLMMAEMGLQVAIHAQKGLKSNPGKRVADSKFTGPVFDAL
jgi:hypothetical protein